MSVAVPLLAAILVGCVRSSAPPDEAAVKRLGGRELTRQKLEEAASRYYAPATYDYFKDMDAGPGKNPGK